MRVPHFVRLGPALVLLGAASSAVFLFAISPASRAAVRADCSASSPCPTPPTPTPTLAFITLDVTSGDPTTLITVNGGAFLANEQMTLYWDTTDKVGGGANADASGNFTTHVKPFAGDSPGVHKLCASVQPYPCANFTLVAATASPSPSPSESPSPDQSPTPTSTASGAGISTPDSTTLNGFDVISKPPFVFLPIVGVLAILLALGYWVMTTVRRQPQLKIPATAVVHRATRPDYSAGFGSPPSTPTLAPSDPSAWADVLPVAGATVLPPAEPPTPAAEPDTAALPPVVEPGAEPPAPVESVEPDVAAPAPADELAAEPGDLPPVDWDLPSTGGHTASADEPPDFPEPGDD